MPIDRVRNDGTVFRKKLNAKRPKGVSGPSDPFFNDLLWLLPLSDNGTSFTDYSPLANVVQINGVNAGTSFAQNSNQTLFGVNTLENYKTNAGEEINLIIDNPGYVFANTDDICIEGFYYSLIGDTFFTSPVASYFINYTGADQFLLHAPSFPNTDWYYRNAGGGYIKNGTAAATWHYIVQQYVALDGKTYTWFDGNQVSVLNTAFSGNAGFRMTVGINSFVPSGPSYNKYSFRWANLRGTKANRYGSAPVIAVPSAPWPTH